MSLHPIRFPTGLFPSEVVVAAGDPETMAGTLFPEESVFVSRMVAKRQREFRAGRLIARAALERLGFQNFPVLVGADRQPVWPSGIIGSISHAEGLCGVAVARKGTILGLGLDIEAADAVGSELHDIVLVPAEREWVAGQPDPRRQSTLIFSAKEAVYKSLCAIEPVQLEFADVRVQVEPESQRFRFAIGDNCKTPAHLPLPSFGNFRFYGQWVITSVVIPGLRSSPEAGP